MAGNNRATKMPMIAITTSNSTSVNAPETRLRMATLLGKGLTSAAELEKDGLIVRETLRFGQFFYLLLGSKCASI
jgi:hypothetical protein